MRPSLVSPVIRFDSGQMNTEKQTREKKTVAATSVAAAIFLTGGKLTIGFLTGSLGILAEAAHSALDLAAAIITFFAVRMSDRPADTASADDLCMDHAGSDPASFFCER